jgi:pSer/pThr/pTyr-binding forkhead associated (FHA) protein
LIAQREIFGMEWLVGVAQGKASPDDQQNAKRPPKTSTRQQGSTKASSAKNVQPPADEMEGLFVDAAPTESKRSGRAADRRRERGQAPIPAGNPDTRQSLRKREVEAKSSMSASQPAGLAKLQLMCTRGPDEGLAIDLIAGSYTIGRARENSFVLKDIAASRHHVRIDVEERGARVVDLGSGNGTRVNGKRIGEHELKHGDRIELGGSVLQFQDKDAPAADIPSSDVDDAQERVIRAAEKLAAELSQRMRFGEQSNAGFEDAHVADTQALPKAARDRLTAEIEQQQPNAERLWKQTSTSLPLDQVVPADDPLRGSRAAADVAMTRPPSGLTRNPLPRPVPLSKPPLSDEESELSASTSRGGSFLMSLLVTTLVVVLGGGIVITLYMLSRSRGADPITQEAAPPEYGKLMEKCVEHYNAGEWFRAREYANLALGLRPGDATAQRYERGARERIESALPLAPTLAPAPPTAPAQPPLASTSAQAPPAASAPRADPAENARRRRSSKAAPRPARGGMSEAVAQEKFSTAVDALREKDNQKGCRVLEEIADKAPPDSRWKQKAENLYSRRCD